MIKGKNFGFTQGTSKVTFHGTLSAPLVWSDDWILAPVPEGATSGLVQVTVNGMVSNGGYGVTSFIVDPDDLLIQKIKVRDVTATSEAGKSGNQLFVPYLKQVLATRTSKGDDVDSPWAEELALAKLGQVPQLQRFWCRAIADDPEHKAFPSVDVLESIGGWFAIQGLQKFLTPDVLFLWLKTAGQENASDVARSTLQLRALTALPKVVPNPPQAPLTDRAACTSNVTSTN